MLTGLKFYARFHTVIVVCATQYRMQLNETPQEFLCLEADIFREIITIIIVVGKRLCCTIHTTHTCSPCTHSARTLGNHVCSRHQLFIHIQCFDLDRLASAKEQMTDGTFVMISAIDLDEINEFLYAIEGLRIDAFSNEILVFFHFIRIQNESLHK